MTEVNQTYGMETDQELITRLGEAARAGEPVDEILEELHRRGHSAAVAGTNVFVDCTFESDPDAPNGIVIE